MGSAETKIKLRTYSKIQDEEELRECLASRKFAWCQDGTNDLGQTLVYREDGTLTACGGEGTWKVQSVKPEITVLTNFHSTDYVIKYNEDATKGVVVTPKGAP